MVRKLSRYAVLVATAMHVASAVSTGAIPGCSGSVVEVLLCITGTSTAKVLDPSLTALPDQVPHGRASSSWASSWAF